MIQLSRFCLFFSLYALVICVSFSTKAQTYGVQGGLALSTVNGQDQMDNIQPGLQVGGYLILGGDNTIFFKSELLFTHKGVRNWRGLEGISSTRLNLVYADLPLMFGIKASERFTINLGFQPSILIYVNYSYHEAGGQTGSTVTSDLTTMDYATVMGLEYNFKGKVFIGMRYCHGFVPIQSREGALDMDGVQPTLMTFQAYCGYKLK